MAVGIYVGGYVAIRRAPASEVPFRPPVMRWGDLSTSYLLRVFATAGAVAITLLGVVPMLASAVEIVAGRALRTEGAGSPRLHPRRARG